MDVNQYSPFSDTFASHEKNFVPQSDAEVHKLLKKLLRQNKKNTALLRFMCFAILSTYEREGALGLNYATMSEMMFNLDPHSKKGKRRTSLNPWSRYDWR